MAQNADKKARIEALRARIGAPAGRGPRLACGLAPIDAALGGGLALAALHAVEEATPGAAAVFAALWLGRRPGGALWVQPAWAADLCAAGLVRFGLDARRLVVAHARTDSDALWAFEEGLRSGALAGAAAEVGGMPALAARRLQIAAERGGALGFALGRADWAKRDQGAPAASRWRVAAAPSEDLRRPRWRWRLLHARGGREGEWEVMWDDAQNSLSVVAALCDGTGVQPS